MKWDYLDHSPLRVDVAEGKFPEQLDFKAPLALWGSLVSNIRITGEANTHHHLAIDLNTDTNITGNCYNLLSNYHGQA